MYHIETHNIGFVHLTQQSVYQIQVDAHAKVPHHGFLAQRLIDGSEPLIQKADPHITKLAIGARM